MSVPQTELLVFVDGQEIARRFLVAGVHIFGSSAECSVQIEAAHVSRNHARITVGDRGSLLLEDLGSTNGTFLDGQRITAPVSIAPNQTIAIGAATLFIQQHTFRPVPDEGTPPELAHAARYEIGAEIAKGGMGAVLAARQPSIRREVALKLMLRDASPHDRLRFIEEAQITGQLEHPNIIPVHELALNEQGQPYYTMKLVKGSTLKEILLRLSAGDPATVDKYSLGALLTTFQKVCDAVAFAHARSVLHRDLKPANIMVGEFGEVLVMDWGLAKVLRADGADAPAIPAVSSAREDQRVDFATLDGAVMGTPQYMSPEQAGGEVATLDLRSDVFSLGAILYELVTLTPPFSGKTTREILAKVIDGKFLLPNARLRTAGESRPRHLRGGPIPNSLEVVIAKALAPDPEQRYQRVEDFQADITAYQNGFAPVAENAGLGKQVLLAMGRHRGMTAVAAVALIVILALSLASFFRIRHERDFAQAQRIRAETENKRRAALLEEASRSDRFVAIERFATGDESGAFAQLGRALRYSPASSLAAEAAMPMILAAHREFPRATLSVQPSGFVRATFSPNGHVIVTTSNEPIARLWDAGTGKQVAELKGHRGQVTTAVFSPDGRRILTSSVDNTARIWNADDGTPLVELKGHTAALFNAAFSPNSERVLTASEDRTACVWDARSGEQILELKHDLPVRNVVFSPDGERILTGLRNGASMVWDAKTGTLIAHLAETSGVNKDDAAFSPDGSRVLRAGSNNTAEFRDAKTGVRNVVFSGHSDIVNHVAFSPGGLHIATASRDKTARLWDAATGVLITEFKGHTGAISRVTFSPDGRRLLTASEDRIARLWDAESGQLLAEFKGHSDKVMSAGFSPDGQTIVTASLDGTAMLWDAPSANSSARPPVSILGGMIHHDSLLLTPDGQRVVTVSGYRVAQVSDIRTGAPAVEFKGHTENIVSIDLSSDGRRVLTSSADMTARIWDVENRQSLVELKGHPKPLWSAEFSADGRRAVTAGGDGIARIWDAQSGAKICEIAIQEFREFIARFSPDGKHLMTAANQGAEVRLWDATRGTPITNFRAHTSVLYCAVFSPDGGRILTTSMDQTARLWDARSGRQLAECKGHTDDVSCAVFSPDGQRVLTGSHDKTARLWDAGSGALLVEFRGHADRVESVAFSPDGQRVLTGSNDKTARLWDATRGVLIAEFRHAGSVKDARFSADGRRIVTASLNGGCCVWDLPPRDPPPPWFGQFLTELAGQRLGEDGRIESLSSNNANWSPSLVELAAQRGDDDYLRILRWRLNAPSKRSTAPYLR